jgi:hypothetical protein
MFRTSTFLAIVLGVTMIASATVQAAAFVKTPQISRAHNSQLATTVGTARYPFRRPVLY